MCFLKFKEKYTDVCIKQFTLKCENNMDQLKNREIING